MDMPLVKASHGKAGVMKAIGYMRVSTAEQAEEGVSLDAQRAMIQAYAQMRGLEVTDIIVDEGVSGARIFPVVREANACLNWQVVGK